MCLSAVSAAGVWTFLLFTNNACDHPTHTHSLPRVPAVHHVPRPEAGDNEWLFEAVLSEEVGEVVTMRAASAADGTGCVLWGAAVKLSPEVAQICQLSPYHERGTLAVMERHNDEDEGGRMCIAERREED